MKSRLWRTRLSISAASLPSGSFSANLSRRNCCMNADPRPTAKLEPNERKRYEMATTTAVSSTAEWASKPTKLAVRPANSC